MNSWLRHGLIAGVAICILMFGPFLIFGAKPEWMKIGELVGYTSMLLCLSATWFAMRRESALQGGLSFGRALFVGVGVSAVAGILFGIVTWIFFAAVGDALPEALMVFYGDQVRSSGASAEVIARQLQELELMRPMLHNHPLQGALMAATAFLIGVAESLLGAWLVSRKPENFAPNGVSRA